jgi:hypothetical protein
MFEIATDVPLAESAFWIRERPTMGRFLGEYDPQGSFKPTSGVHHSNKEPLNEGTSHLLFRKAIVLLH